MALIGTLRSYEILAHNYGADHANAIHNDAGARQHGFAGALVPGVAVYGYLMRPAVNVWGLDWLAHGAATVRFLHPVYHGERVIAEADEAMNLQLLNAAQQVGAIGSATLPAESPRISADDYEQGEMRMRSPTIASFQIGESLGSLAFTLDWQYERDSFLANMNDSNPLYHDALHPAFWLAQANEMFMRNIALGMWIHAASEIQHYELAEDGEPVSLRGRVAELYERKGHEYLVANLAAFGDIFRHRTAIVLKVLLYPLGMRAVLHGAHHCG